jgi:hypothetical protein
MFSAVAQESISRLNDCNSDKRSDIRGCRLLNRAIFLHIAGAHARYLRNGFSLISIRWTARSTSR